MIQNGLEYLNSRLIFGMMPGLASTRKLCEALGNPQKKFKTIHVVGTNGKGSTSYYLSGILQAHGVKTGLYTSPHLVSMRERIRVNDLPIDDGSLDRLIMQVKAAAEKAQVEPTFFEVLTIVAFLYYAEQHIDVAVLEAGMGGRLDSTAVADGELIVLTSIGLEHTEVLGSTESAILKEKMGVAGSAQSILSNGRGKTFVLGGLSEALIAEANVYAASHGCSCVVPEIRNDVELPNLGQHYIENASLSLKAAELFLNNFDETLALKTLSTRSWAGRMQKLIDANGVTKFVLDGAHNSHAVRRLVEALDKYYPEQKFHCVFGALRDKDVGEMLKLMAPHVSHWHITRTPYPRFRELEDLQAELEKLGLHVASAGEFSREYLDEIAASVGESSTPILITGSLYMIGATVQALKDDFDGLSFFRGMKPTTNEHR
ncbi:folylpolyglutamate synthase/dihydrofolate synthase family protein [Fibrobacter succinogenes]|uniref:bifunctional folylpolyglutamate synthase/dihydrofolate synthase n=1 Tax=Fibrobacter succinogenes TaxID=833 RepID=UPI001568A06A|nr:cyanophycin synthetase [Fibrobacter succinogenes]